MTKSVRVLVLAIVMLAGAQPVAAQGVVLESYTGKRPADMSRMLAPLHEELASRGYITGDTLARRYQTRISRPVVTKDGLPPDFADRVERGHKAWVAGRFEEAVSVLGPVIDVAHANAGAFGQNQVLRDRLQRALIALALSQQRRGDLASGRETMSEMLRSYPDTQLSRGQYGPEAFALFEEVRRAHGQGGRGRLIVKVPKESSVVFVNELFQTVGNVNRGDVVPGAYRVYVQTGQQLSRLHYVVVRANQTSELEVDLELDATLQTTTAWSGFEFVSMTDRRRNEGRFANVIGKSLGARAIVVVGIDHVDGRQVIAGSLLSLETGRDIRRASLALDPEPSAERIRALAKFLAGADSEEGLDVQLREKAAPSRAAAGGSDQGDTTASSGVRWKLWGGVAGLGAGLVGGVLAYKSVGDASAAGDELERCMPCTSEQARRFEARQDSANNRAVISGVVGGALAITGVVLLVLHLRGGNEPAPAVSVSPVAGGVVGQYYTRF